jgi:hypothetical protein
MCASVISSLASLILNGLAGIDGVSAQTTGSPVAPASSSEPWVGLTSALAWPIAAIAIALAFRDPLGRFLIGVAGRVTKLSAFKVELELTATPSAAASPLLDDIRSATTSASISDSSRMMLEQAQSTMPADYAVIDLGAGEEWLTSRLFIAAVMLERMRGVKVFVFLESTPTVAHRFVAICTLSEIRWSLACQYPWLEAAWLRAYTTVFPAYPPAGVIVPIGAAWLPDALTINPAPSPIQSFTGALEPMSARNVVSQFIQLLQTSAPATPGPPPLLPAPAATKSIGTPASVLAPVIAPSTTPGDTWVIFASGVQERATWVSRQMLETMLPQEAFEVWADEARDAPRGRRTRGVLRRPGQFVALVRSDREYVRLINRAVLLEEMAAMYGEEPEQA